MSELAGRVPPNDLEAEATVLSACLLSPEVFDEVVDLLRPEHFYSSANRFIMESIVELTAQGRPVDLVATAGWLRDHGRIQAIGGTAYIAQLVDATPAVAHVVEHAETIRSKWRMRQLIQACSRFASEGYGHPGDVQEFIDQAEAAVFEIAHMEERSELVDVKHVVSDCYRVISEAAERGSVVTGTALGITELDRKMSGAHAGDFLVLSGRPGAGKTALAITMTLAVASPRANGLSTEADENGDATSYEPGGAVAYFSLEMPKEQIGNRLLAAEARVDLGRVRAGQLRQDDWSKLAGAATRLARMPIWIDDTPALTLLELRAKCRRLKVQCLRLGIKFALIVVDHIGLMNDSRQKGDSREQGVANLSKGMKVLAKEIEIPVMALAQLNRDCEKRPDKRPQLSDLRETGSLEQDADAVMFVYRDEMYHKESIDRGLAEVILAKQRNGPTGTIKTKWSDFCARFDNLVSSEYVEFDDREEQTADDYGLGPEPTPHWSDR